MKTLLYVKMFYITKQKLRLFEIMVGKLKLATPAMKTDQFAGVMKQCLTNNSNPNATDV